VSELAEEVVHVLTYEPLGLTGRALANKVQRRRAAVLAALRSDPRFEHTGRNRGSRWRLATRAPLSGALEPLGTAEECCRRCGQLLLPEPPTGRRRWRGGGR
jgi:hypothetical protein